uniref:hypothetical protein n=1 Tax=Castellaniella defragrans TaxID=75697 RepID=UPI00333FF64D
MGVWLLLSMAYMDRLALLALYIAVTLVPWALIARKAGYSWLWGFLFMIPFVNFIALWAFALLPWRAARTSAKTPAPGLAGIR